MPKAEFIKAIKTKEMLIKLQGIVRMRAKHRLARVQRIQELDNRK
jgi:hypothetical protein